jgi:PAS domain S-box-containing protein
MRDQDWSNSPLGPPETWPQSLRSVVGLILGSKFPMFVAWGPELGFLYNEPYAGILGAKHPGALGARFHDVWAEIWPDISPLIHAAMAGEATYREDLPLTMNRRGFDEETWFTFSYSPVRDESGRVAGMFCAVAETTKTVLAERHLRESEARTRGVLEGMAEGFVLLDREFRVLDINPEGMRVEQRPREAIIGKTHWEAWPGSEDSELGRRYKRAMVDRVPASLEHRYVWPDGHEAWFEMRCYPSGDGLAIFYRDVTERKQAEAALRLSEERYRQIVEGADDFAIFTLDEGGTITSWNTGAQRITDYTEEDAVGQSGAIIFTPDDRASGAQDHELNRARSGGRAIDERWHLRKNGTRFWASGVTMRLDAPGGGYLKIFRDRTGEHEAEARLHESEAKFQAIANSIDQMIWSTLPDGYHDYYNDRWYEYTGTARGSTDGEGWNGMFHPDDQERAWALWRRSLRTGEPYHIEYRLRHRSGAYRWVIGRAQPVRDDEGRIARWFGTCTDIQEIVDAREVLTRSREELEQRVDEVAADLDRIWRHASDIFVVIDGEGVFRRVNPATSAILGWTEDEMLGRTAFDFLHPDDVAPSLRALEHARGDVLPTFENRYRAKDGEFRTISWVAAPEGPMIYAYGRDITAEKAQRSRLEAAEAARREADALYRAYFENTPEALFVIGVEPDGGFMIEQINPAHEAGVGLKLEEVRGKRVDDVLPPDIAVRILATYGHVVETGTTYQYREVFDLGGEPQHWDTSLVPVRDASGQITRLIGSSRNVTRQVVAEEALRQSQKMEAIGQLTGGVAHDFNNLLTPIVGSLDMLQRRGLGDERERRLIAGAAQSADRAKTLVQRLLAFARRQPLQAVPVDIAKLVTGMAELVSSTTGPQIKVFVEAPDDLPPAQADPNQLEMALLNLAVNARDAMPEGGTLRISASSESVGSDHGPELRPGAYLRLSVADTGTGMDEATLARAAEPFFSTKGIGKGTGLGLSMAHGLASQLGGALKIRSRPGLGTNVELWLPRSSAAPQVVEEAPHAGPDVGGRGTALLVDDEELVRLSTADMLADLGFAVTEAASAEEALRLIDRGQRFDLLVTDHLMPGMTGTDLARAVRSARPDVPVLVVSGYAENDGIAPDLPRLTKPFRKDELAASLALLHPQP